MKPTVREISKVTGFSPATVSNALNGKRGVNPETSGQIQKAAREMGYFESSDTSEALPGGKKRIRLVLFHAGEEPAKEGFDVVPLIRGIEEECDHSRLELSLHYIDRFGPMFEKQVSALSEDRATAVILVGFEMTADDFHYFDGLECPVVMIGFWKEGMRYSAVLPDNELAVAGVVNYLVKKGHRRIGHLRSSRRTTGMIAREYWYWRSLENNHLSCDPADSITLDPGLEDSYRGMIRCLENSPQQMPTAFIADTDEIALGAMKALQEKGVRIPEDISVTGIGDLPFAQIVSPGLSTIRFSGEEIGIVAVQTLCSLNGKRDPSRVRVMISPELVERGSVRDLTTETAGQPDFKE